MSNVLQRLALSPNSDDDAMLENPPVQGPVRSDEDELAAAEAGGDLDAGESVWNSDENGLCGEQPVRLMKTPKTPSARDLEI